MTIEHHNKDRPEGVDAVDGFTLDPSRRHLTLDIEAYRPFLEGTDLNENEKRELIETLWSVIVSFVELGFGVSPLSDLVDRCGEGGPENAPQIETDRVNLTHSTNEEINEEINETRHPRRVEESEDA